MNTTISTASASGGVALAVVVVLNWILGMFHLSMPSDVGVAVATVLTWAVHYAVAIHLLPSVSTPPKGAVVNPQVTP